MNFSAVILSKTNSNAGRLNFTQQEGGQSDSFDATLA